MQIPKDLKDEIWKYCFSNDITDVEGFMLKIFRQGFTSEKYGSTPFKAETKEVIKEVIKEIEVVKEVYISNDEELERMTSELNDLRIENANLKKIKSTTNKDFYGEDN